MFSARELVTGIGDESAEVDLASDDDCQTAVPAAVALDPLREPRQEFLDLGMRQGVDIGRAEDDLTFPGAEPLINPMQHCGGLGLEAGEPQDSSAGGLALNLIVVGNAG